MLLNQNRIFVDDWDGKSPSICPECGGKLIPRKGEINIHHWAHEVLSPNCNWQPESQWHVAIKTAFHKCGWKIEHTIFIKDKKYRLDAYNPKHKFAAEFINTKCEDYLQKHDDLCSSGYVPQWIWNGHKFLNRETKYYKSECKRFLEAFGGHSFIHRYDKSRSEIHSKIIRSYNKLDDFTMGNWHSKGEVICNGFVQEMKTFLEIYNKIQD